MIGWVPLVFLCNMLTFPQLVNEEEPEQPSQEGQALEAPPPPYSTIAAGNAGRCSVTTHTPELDGAVWLLHVYLSELRGRYVSFDHLFLEGRVSFVVISIFLSVL